MASTPIESQLPHSARDPWRNRQGRALGLVGVPFALAGLWLLAESVERGRQEGATEAILEVLFASVFVAVGIGLVCLGVWTHRREAERETLRARHPDRPWMWDVDWSCGRVPSDDGAGLLALTVFGVLWNVVSWPVSIVVLNKDPGALIFVGLFPLCGLGLACWAGLLLLRWWRFGRGVLELDTLPGVIGGRLRGAVHVPAGVQPDDGFELRLRCHEWVGSGDHSHREIRWEERRRVPAQSTMQAADRTVLPADFTIPWGLEPSSPPGVSTRFEWELRATAKLDGPDLDMGFTVPVFATEESDSSITDRDARPVASPTAVSAPNAPRPKSARTRVEILARADGACVVRFPILRDPLGAIVATAATIFWTAIVGLFISRASGLPEWLFLSIFVAAGLYLAFLSIDAWIGSRRLTALPGRLDVRIRWLGLLGWTRRFRSGDIAGFEIGVRGQMGDSPRYSVFVLRPEGGRTAIAHGLRDKREAETIRDRLEAAFGAGERFGSSRAS